MAVQQAIFAAGCFWGVQYYFDQVPGVLSSQVGYTGGHTANPSYEEVCTHTTGHAEAVELSFDESQISYEDLCKHFFKMHDPTQLNRQGPDIGDSYRSAIFYIDDNQRKVANQIKSESAANFKQPIVTKISAASVFYPAEDYHQKFAQRTGRGICHIPYQPLA
ncbi:MAG: hypothetical protein NVS1B10_05240 [Candidatus Saccharimonadales bacterium]